MSQTTVEEILTAVRRLPKHERQRLSELLARERESDFGKPSTTSVESLNQARVSGEESPAPAAEITQSSATAQIPASRDAEMQWLLDHPDFWDQHRGEHVALWGYEMIAVSKNAKEAYVEARRRGIKLPFVQYLPVHEHEWYLGMSNQPAIEP